MTVESQQLQDRLLSTARLHGELATEAQRYLSLLERQASGEDVTGELYASTQHLGTHASLLAERMTEDAVLADQLNDGQ